MSTAAQTSIAVAMPRDRWALLNAIYWRTVGLRPRTAFDILLGASADTNDAAVLQCAGLITAVWKPGDEWGGNPGGPVDLATDLPDHPRMRADSLDHIDLSLTRAGGRWLDNDPHQKVLWAAETARRGRARLVPLRRLGLDRLAVADCFNRGLIVLVNRNNGLPVPAVTITPSALVPDDDDHCLADCGLELTATGRDIIRPEKV